LTAKCPVVAELPLAQRRLQEYLAPSRDEGDSGKSSSPEAQGSRQAQQVQEALVQLAVAAPPKWKKTNASDMCWWQVLRSSRKGVSTVWMKAEVWIGKF